MTIKKITQHTFWRFKWTREEVLAPGQKIDLYSDETGGWMGDPTPDIYLTPTTVRIKSEDELTITYGAESDLYPELKPPENYYEKNEINSSLGHFKDFWGKKEVRLEWTPGKERR